MRFKLIMLTIFLYVSIWLGCGIFYQYAANKYRGECFIFQDNIKMQYEIMEFKDKLKVYQVRDKTIKTLFLKDSDEKFIYYNTNKDNKVLYTIQQVGIDWANYYEEKFVSVEKITHFRIKELKQEGLLYNITLSLYRVKGDFSKTKDPNNDNELYEYVRDEYISIQKMPDVYNFIINNKIVHIPVKGILRDFIETSNTAPGIDWITFELVKNGQYKYPLVDFLYFSAVTITTLGYGDILPNSSLIRCIVMIETFSGLILMGIGISVLFASKEQLKRINSFIKNFLIKKSIIVNPRSRRK